MSPFQLLPLLALTAVYIGCGREQGLPAGDTGASGGLDPVQLTDTNFQREVLESNVPVLVDMWAPWCQPCIAMKPTIRRVAEELAGQAKVAELNVDENPFIKEKYKVDRYPMLLIFVDGVEVKRVVGLKTKEDLIEALRTATSEESDTDEGRPL